MNTKQQLILICSIVTQLCIFQNIQASVTTEQLISGVAKAKAMSKDEKRDDLGYSDSGDCVCDAYRNQVELGGPGNIANEPDQPEMCFQDGRDFPSYVHKADAVVKAMRQNKCTFKTIERSIERIDQDIETKVTGLLSTFASTVATAVGNKAQGLLPAQVEASTVPFVPVGTLPIAAPDTSFSVGLWRKARELKEKRTNEENEAHEKTERRLKELKEKERKKQEEAVTTSPVSAQRTSNSTTNFFQATAAATASHASTNAATAALNRVVVKEEKLRLEEARLKVEQLFAQLKKDSKKEEEENQRAAEVVANAHRQTMQQLTTLRSETTQLLEAVSGSGGSNSSNGSGGSSSSGNSNSNGSRSSNDRDSDHGHTNRSSTSSSSSSGWSWSRDSNGNKCGKSRDNTGGMWGHD